VTEVALVTSVLQDLYDDLDISLVHRIANYIRREELIDTLMGSTLEILIVHLYGILK
jgi:hypothetical protein